MAENHALSVIVVDGHHIRSPFCGVCAVPVSLADLFNGSVTLYRIQGDSANGYEPVHHRCLEG